MILWERGLPQRGQQLFLKKQKLDISTFFSDFFNDTIFTL